MKGVFFLVSLLVLFLVFSVLSFMLPSTVVIANQVVVKAPVEKVQAQVEHFTNWQNWNDAFQDPGVQIKFLPPDSSRVELHDSSKVVLLSMLRPGNDTINVLFSGEGLPGMEYEFTFMDRETIHSNLMLQVRIQLKWYPWERVKGLFMQKMAANYYESMLDQLKTAAEANAYSHHR